MLLREFFTADKTPIEGDNYSPADDSRVIDSTDTRKTRLCLWDIHKARIWSDNAELSRKDELVDIQKIYKAPAEGAL